jgi:hypothetical protein
MSEQLQQARRTQSEGNRLSSEELAAVLQDASRRQGEAIKNEDATRDLSTVDDAYAVAEELGIPAEHVRAALASRQSGKAGSVVPGTLILAVGGAAVTAAALYLLGVPWLIFIPGGIAAGVVIAAAGLIAAAMRRNPQKLSGPPPVPGTCRVCFKPAHTPESTFCEEHRHKMQGAAKP